MSLVVTCTSCQTILRVQEQFAGKKMKCPRCSAVFDIPSWDADVEEEFEVVEEEGKAAGEEENPFEFDEEAQGKKAGAKATQKIKKVKEEDLPPRRKSAYLPCPDCGNDGAKRIPWTFWGRYYWTNRYCHVACTQCGYRYNGETGESNLIPAILLVTLPLLVFLLAVGALLLGLIRQGHLKL